MLRKTPIEVAPRLGVKGAAIASNVKPKMTIHQLVEKIKPKLVEDDSVSLVLHSHKKDGRVLLPEMQLSDALKEQGNPEALRLFYSFEVEDSAEQFALSVLADGSSSAQASAAGTSAEAELAADGMRLPASMAKGRERLTALVVGREAEWSALPSTKKHHKQRSAIDRRFDGPKSRRTRDFSDDFYDDLW